jgi:Phosphate-induced protein 1 conserved region
MKSNGALAGILIAGSLLAGAASAATAATAKVVTPTPAPAAASAPLTYHGGAVLTGPTHIYYLWYGDWSKSGALPILTDFASGLGGSDYYKINTAHTDAAGKSIPKTIIFSGSAVDDYSLGRTLAAGDVLKALRGAIRRHDLPLDANGVYFVLTAADVEETSGFCTDYCSWHHHAKVGGVSVKYAFVGDPSRCAEACELAPGNTPNGDVAGDSMVASLAARLNETVTNPEADGWFDAAGRENTDKCMLASNPFGPTFPTADGAHANLRLGARNFLVPQNWVNTKSGGHCALSAQ